MCNYVSPQLPWPNITCIAARSLSNTFAEKTAVTVSLCCTESINQSTSLINSCQSIVNIPSCQSINCNDIGVFSITENCAPYFASWRINLIFRELLGTDIISLFWKKRKKTTSRKGRWCLNPTVKSDANQTLQGGPKNCAKFFLQ